VQQLNRLQRCCGLGCLAAGAPKSGEAVAAGSARCFRDAQEGRQECAAQLVCERGVAPRKTTGDGVTQLQRLPGNGKCIEPMVVESRNTLVSVFSAPSFVNHASRPRSAPSNTNSNTLTLTLTLTNTLAGRSAM
jgi:hypothetical protein